MITSAICRVNGIRSQKPRPHASIVCVSVAGVTASAAPMTRAVAISAKMNASGTQRSVQSVSASAARATGPGCSVILSGGYLNIGRPMPLLSESPIVLPIHRKILAVSFIGWIFDFYDLLLLSFLISPSVTSIVKDLALTPNEVAVLLGTPLAFTAVGGFIGCAMADRFGRKPLLMATILVYSLGTLAAGLSIGFWTLLAARAVTGIGVGGEWAVAHALVGETVPPA